MRGRRTSLTAIRRSAQRSIGATNFCRTPSAPPCDAWEYSLAYSLGNWPAQCWNEANAPSGRLRRSLEPDRQVARHRNQQRDGLLTTGCSTRCGPMRLLKLNESGASRTSGKASRRALPGGLSLRQRSNGVSAPRSNGWEAYRYLDRPCQSGGRLGVFPLPEMRAIGVSLTAGGCPALVSVVAGKRML